MAEEKNSIIVYADWIDKFEELSDEEAGRLIKHFFRYVNDQNPVAPDRVTKLSFIDIEKSLKRDLNKWELIKIKRSEAGKASAEAKRIAKEAEQNKAKSTSVESVEQTSTKSTVSVNDNVNGNVSVSVNDIKDDDDYKIESSSSLIFSLKKFERVEIGENEFTLLACRRSGKTIEQVKILFKEFLDEQRAVSKKVWKNEPDAKTHFHNWIAKKKDQANKPNDFQF